MKKKFLVVLFAVIMAVACAFGMVACGDDEDSVAGTYIMYIARDAEAMAGDTEIVLKDGKATMQERSHSKDGTYTVKDGKLVITFDDDPATFTKSDNYWYLEESGSKLLLCKKGETPKGYTVVEDEEGDY